MKTTEIKNIYFHNSSITALYCGNTLIWENNKEQEDLSKYEFYVKGKFTDDSTENDWKLCTYYVGTNIQNYSIKDFVNPETKEFEFKTEEDSNGNYNYSKYAFIKNDKLESIDSFIINKPNRSVDIQSSFNECKNLKEIKKIKINGLLTSINYTFYDCENVEKLDLSNWDISQYNSNTLGSCLIGCENLKELNISYWDFNKITNNNGFIIKSDLPNLTTVIGPVFNIKCRLYLSDAPNLTKNSILVILNGIEEVSSTQRLYLTQEQKDSLTNDELAIATSKGYTVYIS